MLADSEPSRKLTDGDTSTPKDAKDGVKVKELTKDSQAGVAKGLTKSTPAELAKLKEKNNQFRALLDQSNKVRN